ncbi:hypothetical protein T02_6375, partial [Trichinella nativa]
LTAGGKRWPGFSSRQTAGTPPSPAPTRSSGPGRSAVSPAHCSTPGQRIRVLGVQRIYHAGEILGKSPVIRCQSQELPDFSHAPRRGPLLERRRILWIGTTNMLRHDVAQVAYALPHQLALLRLDLQSHGLQAEQHPFQAFQVLLLCLPEDDNIVEIEEAYFPPQSPQRFLHQTLKRRRGVAESERHHAELEELVRPRSASPREMAFPHFRRPCYSARYTPLHPPRHVSHPLTHRHRPPRQIPHSVAWPQLRSRCWAARPGMGHARSSPSSRPSGSFLEFASRLSERTSPRSSFPGHPVPPDSSPPLLAHVPSNGPIATAPPPLP